MLRTSVALNESSGEIDSLLLPSTTTVAESTESIASSNMEETIANVSTDDSSKSNNIQNENESNASNDVKITTKITMSTEQFAEPPINAELLANKTSNASTPTIGNPSSSSSISKLAKKKAVQLLSAPNFETIRDDISSTTEKIKRLKHVQIRSNSTGKLYQSSRRVSFPENDSELVTGYLEPADPWAYG